MTTTDITTVIGTDGIVWTRCEGDHPEAVAHGVLGIARPADMDDVDLATGPDGEETLAACLIRLGRTTLVETAIGDVLVVVPVSTPEPSVTEDRAYMASASLHFERHWQAVHAAVAAKADAWLATFDRERDRDHPSLHRAIAAAAAARSLLVDADRRVAEALAQLDATHAVSGPARR
jgi:hypothetical protein